VVCLIACQCLLEGRVFRVQDMELLKIGPRSR
jgi:hypothetical protein